MFDRLEPDPLVVGQRIAGLRRQHGWSQRRLAEVAGVSHGYIAQLELGRLPSPGKFRLDAVARALHLRTADALLGPDEPLDDDDGEREPPTAEPGPQAGPRRSASRAASGAANPSRAASPAGPSSPSTRAVPVPPSVVGPSATLPETGQPAVVAPSGPATAAQGQERLAGNVLGAVDQVRAAGARPLPIFQWGSCGDPRDRESPPDPDRLEFPPPGREMLIGPNGFGVVVKGESMAGRGIHDGDVVWVNPDRPYQLGKVVLALVSDASGESGMVVKGYGRTEVGECLLSEPTAGVRSPVVCQQFHIIGPVVGITSWRLPT